MPEVTFIDRVGEPHTLNVENGISLMQISVDNSIDGIVAECGGACSCATCHVYVDEPWLARLNPPSETEEGLLECVIDPQPNSRLSCQIKLSDELDGIVVRIPRAQY